MGKLCLAKPSLHGTTGCRSPPFTPGSWLQVSSPGLCISGTPATFPQIKYLPSHSPISQDAFKTSLPMLCRSFAPYAQLSTHLPLTLCPTSRHLTSGQLSHLAGNKVIRVPTLRQRHVQTALESYTVFCGLFKPRPKKQQHFCSGPLPFHARVTQSQVKVLQCS